MNEEQLKQLKSKQEDLILIEKELSIKRTEFEEVNKVLFDKIESIIDEQDKIKYALREQAVEDFAQTGEKKLLGGIGIRILNKLEYKESEAIEWAKKNMPIIINEVIDKKQFETFAKINDLSFVKKEEKVSVTFPKEIKI